MEMNGKKSNLEDEKKTIELVIELNEEGELLVRMLLEDGYVEFDWGTLVVMENFFKGWLGEED